MSILTNKNIIPEKKHVVHNITHMWDSKELIKTVDSHLKKDGLIPMWLAEPVHIRCYIDSVLEEYDLESLDEVFGEEYLIAGGFLTKLFYKKEWESDVDIWLNSEKIFKDAKIDKKYRTTRKKMSDAAIMAGAEIDLIYNDFKSFLEVITNFDLSCCQIGYERKTKRILVTPLFMYTYFTGKVIVMPRNVMINYRGTVPTIKGFGEKEIKKSMKELFLKKRVSNWETRGTIEYNKNLKYQSDRLIKYTKRGIAKSSAIVFLE